MLQHLGMCCEKLHPEEGLVVVHELEESLIEPPGADPVGREPLPLQVEDQDLLVEEVIDKEPASSLSTTSSQLLPRCPEEVKQSCWRHLCEEQAEGCKRDSSIS